MSKYDAMRESLGLKASQENNSLTRSQVTTPKQKSVTTQKSPINDLLKSTQRSAGPRISKVKEVKTESFSLSEPKIKGGSISQYNPSFLDKLKNLFIPRRNLAGTLELPAINKVRDSDVVQSFGQGLVDFPLVNQPIVKLADKVADVSYQKAEEKGRLPYGRPKEPEPYVPQSTAGKIAYYAGGFAGDAPLMPINLGSNLLKTKTALNPVAREVISQGLTGGVLGTAQGIVEGDNASDVAKRAAFGTALGGTLGGATKGIPKAVSKVKENRLNKHVDTLIPELKINPLEEVQRAYRAPSLRDVRQAELERAFANLDTPTGRTGVTPSSPAEYFGNTSNQADYEGLFGSPIKRYSFTSGRQRMYEDLFNGKPVPENPGEYFGKISQADLEKVWGKPLQRYSIKPRKQIEYENLFSGDDVFFSPKREAAKANATPEMQLGGKPTQTELESLIGKPLKSYRASTDVQNAITEIEAQLDSMISDIASGLRQANNFGEKNALQLVKDMGGIAPSRTGALTGEYNQSVPIWLRNNNGRPLDEVADELGMTASELLNEMSNPVNKVGRKTVQDYLNEAYIYAANDPEFQALQETLTVLKQSVPEQKALGYKPKVKSREISLNALEQPLITKEVPPSTARIDTSNVRLQPRDLSRTREGKPYPFDLRPREISEGSKANVGLGKTVQPGQEFIPRTSEGLQLEPRIWTNRDEIPISEPPRIEPLPKQEVKTLEPLPPLRQVAAGIDDVARLADDGGLSVPKQTPIKKATSNAVSKIEPLDTKQFIASKTTRDSENILKRGYDNYVSSIIDDLYPISKYNTESYQKALNTRQSDMIAHRSLTAGLVDKNGNVINEALGNITKEIPKGKALDFVDYLINRHAPTWIEQGRKVFPDEAGVTADVARAKAAQYESQYPAFKQLGDRFTKYQQNLAREWVVDSGFMSPEAWDGLVSKYPDYVPFQREFSQLEGVGKNFAKAGFVNHSNPIKKGVGSQRKIIDPIETVIERTGQYVKTAKRNEVMNPIVDDLIENPDAYDGIISIVSPKTASLSPDAIIDVNKILQEDGIDGLLEMFNKPWESQKFLANKGGAVEKGANIVTVMRDGSPVHLKVEDMDLLKAVSNLNPQQATAITRAVGKATGVMKTLTTGINPIFGLARNIWRDIVTGYVNSKTINANPLRYVEYMYDLVRAVGNTIAEPLGRSELLPKTIQGLFKKGGEPMAYFKNIGGGGHVSAISGDRNLLAKAKSDIMPKTGTQQALSIPSKLYRGIENLNNTLEVAPRLAEAKRVLKKGGTPDQALFESQDITTNFSRKGSVTKEADAFIPFLNASVQGLDKTIRTFNPASAGTKNVAQSVVKAVTAITIPSLILYAWNHGDEAYQKLSAYQKDNYFNVPNGDGTFTKIPKPREYGVVFGALPERTMSAWRDQDPEAFNKFSDTIKQNFMPPTEPIWQSGYDIWSTPQGKDWRDRPVVSQSLVSRSPRYQYDENTSEPAKTIGNVLNLSPKKIDATAKSYLGGVAQLGIPATTKGKSVLDTLKSQITADPIYSNDISTDFYDRLDKLSTVAADKNFAQNIPSKKVTPEEDIKSSMQGISTAASRGFKQINKIQATSSPDKEEKIRAIRKQILELMSQANKADNSREMQLVEDRANRIFKK